MTDKKERKRGTDERTSHGSNKIGAKEGREEEWEDSAFSRRKLTRKRESQRFRLEVEAKGKEGGRRGGLRERDRQTGEAERLLLDAAFGMRQQYSIGRPRTHPGYTSGRRPTAATVTHLFGWREEEQSNLFHSLALRGEGCCPIFSTSSTKATARAAAAALLHSLQD